MKDLLVLLAHLLTTIAKLPGPGGARTVVADSLIMKQQILVLNRSRRRAPNLSTLDRFLFGLWSLFLDPRRIQRATVIIRPSTLLKFHDLLINRKDLVRRVLAKHYRPTPDDNGPSWLTFIGHAKDSLWSIDLFRCESILLNTHWVLVVMDQFTLQCLPGNIPSDSFLLQADTCWFDLPDSTNVSILRTRGQNDCPELNISGCYGWFFLGDETLVGNIQTFMQLFDHG
jgi:hypothetical protein